MTDRRAQRLLRQHVRTDELLGVDVVPVASPPPAGLPTADRALDASPPPIDQPIDQSPSTTPSAHPPRASESPTPTPRRSRDSGDDPAVRLHAIDANEVRACTKCPLHLGRTQTVFGEGDPHADLMFIGEGPGEKEDRQGRPFVGPAGQMLDKQIVAMGLTRERVYIANVVKCRPPNNRAPLEPEIDACRGYLRRQIDIIRPRVIVTLGGPATKSMLGVSQGITALRGTWHQYDGLLPDGPVIPVMPSFHPAYLLRVYTEENRRKVWSDLQQVMDFLGLTPQRP
jgi:DNA polymerase